MHAKASRRDYRVKLPADNSQDVPFLHPHRAIENRLLCEGTCVVPSGRAQKSSWGSGSAHHESSVFGG